MRGWTRRLLGACAPLIILVPAGAALAHNGMQDIATTIQQIGRGGAFIATDPDVGALQGNPGALAFLDRPQAYIDARLLESSVDYEGLLAGTGDKARYVIPNAGYAGPLSERAAWGLGVFSLTWIGYASDGYDLSLVGAPPGTSGRLTAKVRYITVTPGFAYKLCENTAVGAAFNWTSGETNEEAYSLFGDTTGHRLAGLAGDGYSLRLGLYHRASPATTLGAYWRSRSHLDVTGGTLTMGPLSEAPGVVLENVEVSGGDFPEEYGVGLGQRLSPELTGYAEYRRLRWSKAREVVTVTLPQGDPIMHPQYWEDQDVYLLGAEYRPDCTDGTIWRFGVNYGESPVPDEWLSPQAPSITEWHYTLGWERALDDGLRLSAGAVYAAKNEQTTPAESQLNMLYGGGQPYSASHDSWQFGLGLTWLLGGKGEPCAPPCPSAGVCEIPPDGGNQAYAALRGNQ